MQLWFSAWLEQPQGHVILTAWVIWIIVSITLHELSHGWAAVRLGDTTPIDTGHMTLNPVVHMGVPSLVMFALTGMAWGAMPVDPTRLRGRHGDAWVSFAGPAMNIALAIGCILAAALWETLARPSSSNSAIGAQTYENIRMFFRIGAFLNIALFCFNMLPAPPLDGSRILASFCRPYREILTRDVGRFLGAVVFVLAFIFASELVAGVGGAITRAGIAAVKQVFHLLGAP